MADPLFWLKQNAGLASKRPFGQQESRAPIDESQARTIAIGL